MSDDASPEDIAELVRTRDELETKIEEFCSKNLKRPGVMTGYVLFTTHLRFDDNGDEMNAYDYSVGDRGSIFNAIGMVEVGLRHMHRDLASDDDD